MPQTNLPATSIHRQIPMPENGAESPVTSMSEVAPMPESPVRQTGQSESARIDATLNAVCLQVDEIERALASIRVDATPATMAIRELLQELRGAPAVQGLTDADSADAPTAGCTPASALQQCAWVLRSALPFVHERDPLQPLLCEIEMSAATANATVEFASRPDASRAQATTGRLPESTLRRCIKALGKAARFLDEALGLKEIRDDLKRGADSMILRMLGSLALFLGIIAAGVTVSVMATPGAGIALIYGLMAIAMPLSGYAIFSLLERRVQGVAA